MNATTVEIDSGHLSLITHPQEVTQLILSATQAASQYPQQAAAEDTRDQCVPLPGADTSAATITSSTWSSRLQAQELAIILARRCLRFAPGRKTLPTGLLLAGAGGFLGAYTFVGRGGVFANAQTGNIVLLAVAAGERRGRRRCCMYRRYWPSCSE